MKGNNFILESFRIQIHIFRPAFTLDSVCALVCLNFALSLYWSLMILADHSKPVAPRQTPRVASSKVTSHTRTHAHLGIPFLRLHPGTHPCSDCRMRLQVAARQMDPVRRAYGQSQHGRRKHGAHPSRAVSLPCVTLQGPFRRFIATCDTLRALCRHPIKHGGA